MAARTPTRPLPPGDTTGKHEKRGQRNNKSSHPCGSTSHHDAAQTTTSHGLPDHSTSGLSPWPPPAASTTSVAVVVLPCYPVDCGCQDLDRHGGSRSLPSRLADLDCLCKASAFDEPPPLALDPSLVSSNGPAPAARRIRPHGDVSASSSASAWYWFGTTFSSSTSATCATSRGAAAWSPPATSASSAGRTMLDMASSSHLVVTAVMALAMSPSNGVCPETLPE